MRGALYLRWRPQVFNELAGQEHIKKTLLNALKEGKVGHAYLFCGPRGTGKTTTARLLAKALNCENPKGGEPCNKCESCTEINEDKSLDLIEIDAASNRGIDEIRNLKEKVRVSPAKSKYKIFIIDEVHMLTKEAFNALLKTLEEPPKHVIFILATTEVHKVPLTILSRCQRFDFHLINQEDLREKLKKIIKKEKIDLDDQSLDLIIRKAKGSYRDAESLLDQLAAYTGQKVSFETVKEILGLPDFSELSELAKLILERNQKKALEKIETLIDKGEDLEQLVIGLIDFFRNCLLFKVGGEKLVGEVSKEELKIMESVSKEVAESSLFQLINLLTEAQSQLKVTEIERLPLEIAILEYCKGVAREDLNSEEPVTVKPQAASVTKPIEKKEVPAEPVKPAPPRSLGDKETLETIQQNWDRVLEKVKAFNHSIRAFLQAGTPQAVENGILIINYRFAFHKERMDELKSQQVVEKIITELTGLKLRLRGELNPKQAKKPTTPNYNTGKGTTTKDVSDVFGGGKEIS